MFIKNFSSIDEQDIVLLDDPLKEYLQSLGYYPFSLTENKWVFSKTDELLNIINTYRKEVRDVK